MQPAVLRNVFEIFPIIGLLSAARNVAVLASTWHGTNPITDSLHLKYLTSFCNRNLSVRSQPFTSYRFTDYRLGFFSLQGTRLHGYAECNSVFEWWNHTLSSKIIVPMLEQYSFLLNNSNTIKKISSKSLVLLFVTLYYIMCRYNVIK